jgi:hypothetical protein
VTQRSNQNHCSCGWDLVEEKLRLGVRDPANIGLEEARDAQDSGEIRSADA